MRSQVRKYFLARIYRTCGVIEPFKNRAGQIALVLDIIYHKNMLAAAGQIGILVRCRQRILLRLRVGYREVEVNGRPFTRLAFNVNIASYNFV